MLFWFQEQSDGDSESSFFLDEGNCSSLLFLKGGLYHLNLTTEK